MPLQCFSVEPNLTNTQPDHLGCVALDVTRFCLHVTCIFCVHDSEGPGGTIVHHPGFGITLRDKRATLVDDVDAGVAIQDES